MTVVTATLAVLLVALFAGSGPQTAFYGSYRLVACTIGDTTDALTRAGSPEPSGEQAIQTVPVYSTDLVSIPGSIEPDIDATAGSHAARQSQRAACSAARRWAQAAFSTGRDFDAQAPPAA